jgi:hypothetical protein
MTARIHEFPTLGTRPVSTGPEGERALVRSGGEVDLDDPMQPLATNALLAARNAGIPDQELAAISGAAGGWDLADPRQWLTVIRIFAA